MTSCDQGKLSEVVEALNSQVQGGLFIPFTLFYRVLKLCMAEEDLALGKRVHALTIESGYEGNSFLANHIICMYASHRKLEEAKQVFTTVTAPNAHTWTYMILAQAKRGQPAQALELYREMRRASVKPDNHIFVAVLKAWASARDLAFGKEVHADIMGGADKPYVFVCNCLVDLYAKCGNLLDARRVFDSMTYRDVVTWNSMISGYTLQGCGQEALILYACLQKEDDRTTFACLLQACASVEALQQGKQFHAAMLKRGLQDYVVVGEYVRKMWMP